MKNGKYCDALEEYYTVGVKFPKCSEIISLKLYLNYAMEPKHCSPTSQPFISFKILNKNDSTILFLEKLKNSKTSFPFVVQSHNDIITYGYADGDEGYCETTDKYSILP
jgi:hypothetical protein